MGLVPANPKVDSDIVDPGTHVLIDGLDLGSLVDSIAGEFHCLGPNFGGWHDALPLQAVVPASQLLPTAKAAELNIGSWQNSPNRTMGHTGFSLLFTLEVGARPGKDPASALFGNHRSETCTFEFDFAVAGHGNLDLLVQHHLVGKAEAHPKLSGNQRFVLDPMRGNLQDIAYAKPFY